MRNIIIANPKTLDHRLIYRKRDEYRKTLCKKYNLDPNNSKEWYSTKKMAIEHGWPEIIYPKTYREEFNQIRKAV